MSARLLVPPVKCQGIKTKLVPTLRRLADRSYDRWIEPFCGSCVVPLNIQPRKALLTDTNIHLIKLYREIQAGVITPAIIRAFLTDEGSKLRIEGESYFKQIRERFNRSPNSLDFLFLNRSCFNGLIRFNRKGQFNTPYGHKPERFAQAYVTKISNQLAAIAKVSSASDWTFEVADFRTTLGKVAAGDLVYADPPYAGRHTDYYNQWSEADEEILSGLLAGSRGDFILSTWYGNAFRSNPAIEQYWTRDGFFVTTQTHFYHLGAAEELRHPMLEAFITNFRVEEKSDRRQSAEQALMFS